MGLVTFSVQSGPTAEVRNVLLRSFLSQTRLGRQSDKKIYFDFGILRKYVGLQSNPDLAPLFTAICGVMSFMAVNIYTQVPCLTP